MQNREENRKQHFRGITPFCCVLLTSFIVSGIDNMNATECGTANFYREALLGGKEALRNEWPFIAALYYSRLQKYFCGGTIISEKHVLTAAHCIQKKSTGNKLSPDEVTVRLGAYNLTARGETGVVDRNVSQIHVHPDWKVFEESYDADIAVLVLDRSITFSSQIRPVCMVSDDMSMEGLTGTIVGWGKTENGIAEGIPRRSEIHALNDSYCYATNDGIAKFASERSFCGVGDGTPNAGDSGGGFFAVSGSTWIQFGTISFVRPNAIGQIMTTSTGIYMKLTSLKDWISNTVRQSGDILREATTKINALCTYAYFTYFKVYGCRVHELFIRSENFVVNSFTGSHESGNGDEDVELIIFRNGVLRHLPANFGNIFKNLKYLYVSFDGKRMFRSNFQHLEHLEVIKFRNSSLVEFDEDSLWDLPNLEIFVVEKSELKFLHAATFSRNIKLTKVKVVSGGLKLLPHNLFRNNVLLEYVHFEGNAIEAIDETIFETNADLFVVSFSGNRLEHLSENLFRNNTVLSSIDLSDNVIRRIDEQSFKTNDQLVSLSLTTNRLEFLPPQLLQGKILLEEVDISGNALTAIDGRFFETNVQLGKIYLGSNQLTRLHKNLFRNNSLLETVDFSNNAIGAIDEQLFEMNTLLQTVCFDRNRLDELPENLFRHNAMLAIVKMSRNVLETISEHTFETNGRLREVSFEQNRLTLLPRKLFEMNSELEIVDFEMNMLEAMDEQIFGTNGNLREVYLAANLMDSLPLNLFRNNILLEIVDLSNNFLKTIDEQFFVRNSNLQKISLAGNRLQSLPRNLLLGKSLLQHIDFDENSLQHISVIFTEFKSAYYINLSGNVCVDALFNTQPSKFTNKFTNLTEFHEHVLAKCAPVKEEKCNGVIFAQKTSTSTGAMSN